MSSAPAARIFGFVASEADVCILLRQAPLEETLMVKWNLKTDKFETGQWLKAPLSPGNCDLSPKGDLFAVHTIGRWPIRPDSIGPYLSVSRPPFFTALAFWRVVGERRGNVRWKDDRELWIDRPAQEERSYNRNAPETFVLRSIDLKSVGQLTEERVLERMTRIERSGWKMREVAYRSYTLDDTAFRSVWADIDHRGRLLLAREGRIFVRDAAGERELIDLNPHTFQAVPPKKWATEWP